MTFEDLMALLGDCADRGKEEMFDDELSLATTGFIGSVVRICEKYGKDANDYVELVLGAAMIISRVFNFNAWKGNANDNL